MKNIKKIIGISFLALSVTAMSACEMIEKKDVTAPVMAQATTNEHKHINNTVKIALLLDTSNSMDGLIDQAKAQLWDIVNKFAYVKARCGNDTNHDYIRPNLEIALYQYGNDYLASQEGYIQQVLGFSGDLDEISEKLFSLSTNGGEEYCGQVIQTSLNQLDWGKNADNLKMIFIAGNEPFTQGKLNYKDAVTNAKEKDVVINTIFCGEYQQGVSSQWKNGAILTGGDYMAIDHNKHIVHIDTPYDADIVKLNSKLNHTYIAYGSLGKAKLQKQYAQDNNAMEVEEAVAVKRAVSKSSRLYNNATWDLVDAADDEEFDTSKLEKEQLPVELKNKSDKEIENYIGIKKEERTAIQLQIQELNKKRELFITKNQIGENQGGLENAMLSAIKKQAELKNYKWDN
ncbi:VWA domain-containing protein [Cellulophaga sp. E16_2]|uniref:von Willebrand factor type A n=1 Tax=Cellulophaga algicola (strain DSM 14237 / IC166 / ACAM 630) TaxID=688270 RepID=E6X4S2_CELAD|nr:MULTISPECIES: vWA domain-containing protein [Cellulophaga]ADV49397.1 von Willebrand factor type A [Cellulophaga algicola DSM 14237]MBO0591850.1 VWA domain-containing protein [Cellulophaga sp. E16_2]